MLYFIILFTTRIERKCFSVDEPIGLYHGYNYVVVFSPRWHEVHLECRRCGGHYPPLNATVSWASISLGNGENSPKIKVFKNKVKKYMQIMENYTLTITRITSKQTGLMSCNITIRGLDNITSTELINYFVEVINPNQGYHLGTTSDWIEYRDEILQPIDFKLIEEGLEDQEAKLEIFWTHWGLCLCGLHQFDSRKYRYAYPLVHVNESNIHKPVFPAWSQKFKNLYPFFASISMNATIFKQYNRCIDNCAPNILEEDVDFKHSEKAYIEEESSEDFRCPNITKDSEIIWVYNDEILLNKTLHALGTEEQESHISVDTENILHLSNIKRSDGGSYSCIVDGMPMLDIQVFVIEKFILLTEDGRNAMKIIGLVLLGYFVIWLVILVLKGCCIFLTAER